ncbi:hypothetical protein [Staphylococcus sp. GDK8D30P]|uniref:hypothetical protein n=1 Tax=Staphylococcus sp. GDK8D30P TaxID=2804090 RepID=UPI001AEC5893|nr:hypothetical protein [Staphylococcus sp. GDK8D30P]
MGSTLGNTVSTIVADVPDTPTTAPAINLLETNITQLRVDYAVVAGNGGSPIISYHLQRTNGAGTGFYDVIGGSD